MPRFAIAPDSPKTRPLHSASAISIISFSLLRRQISVSVFVCHLSGWLRSSKPTLVDGKLLRFAQYHRPLHDVPQLTMFPGHGQVINRPNVFPMAVPQLRERRQDIAVLSCALFCHIHSSTNNFLQGGQVKAVALVRGRLDSAPQDTVVKLQFSGYEWLIRAIPSSRNGPTHDYDPKNAYTDSKGALHLQITDRQGKWICSEVTLTKNLGYGTYLFTVEDVSHLEPATIFSAFTWDELPTDPNHREMDVEISRWGDPADENQFRQHCLSFL